MSSYKEIADKWAVKSMADIERKYIERRQRASGQFGDSLEDKVTVTESNINIQILGAAQIGVMQQGRKPNQNTSPESLKAWVGWAGSTIFKQWVKDKGLSINPFAVAWSVARKGVKVPNKNNDGRLLEESITKESIDSLISELGSYFVDSMKSKYIEAWQ